MTGSWFRRRYAPAHAPARARAPPARGGRGGGRPPGPGAAEGEKAKNLIAFAGAISTATGGRYTPQIGGLPITVDGEHAGGMGASGAKGEQDEAVVRAALESVLGS